MVVDVLHHPEPPVPPSHSLRTVLVLGDDDSQVLFEVLAPLSSPPSISTLLPSGLRTEFVRFDFITSFYSSVRPLPLLR